MPADYYPEMIRLGIVGVDNMHAADFAALFNGFTPEYRESYGRYGEEPQTIPGARVEAVWGMQEEQAAKLAEAFGIPFVAGAVGELLGRVEGVLVLALSGREHLGMARRFLEAGVPTFVDKPLAEDAGEAGEIVRLAREHGAPLLSTSALRYAIELEPLRGLVDGEGGIIGGLAFGPFTYSREDWRYGIHPVEGIISLVGTGVESVLSVGTEKNQVVRLKYGDGRVAVVASGSSYYSFDYTVWGEGWRGSARVSNHYQYYRRTMEAFLEMVESGHPPVPYEETLEVIRVVLAAEESIASGEEVAVWA